LLWFLKANTKGVPITASPFVLSIFVFIVFFRTHIKHKLYWIVLEVIFSLCYMNHVLMTHVFVCWEFCSRCLCYKFPVSMFSFSLFNTLVPCAKVQTLSRSPIDPTAFKILMVSIFLLLKWLLDFPNGISNLWDQFKNRATSSFKDTWSIAY
jgi:hypothetical protein